MDASGVFLIQVLLLITFLGKILKNIAKNIMLCINNYGDGLCYCLFVNDTVSQGRHGMDIYVSNNVSNFKIEHVLRNNSSI